MKLPNSSSRKCKLLDMLYMPALSYNLLSVSKAAENGKVTKFDNNGCKILNRTCNLIAKANKLGNLYYLDYEADEQATLAQQESRERVYGTVIMATLGCKVSGSYLEIISCVVSITISPMKSVSVKPASKVNTRRDPSKQVGGIVQPNPLPSFIVISMER